MAQVQAPHVNGNRVNAGEGARERERTDWYGGATRFELELEVS